jgi:hypothetical protein
VLDREVAKAGAKPARGRQGAPALLLSVVDPSVLDQQIDALANEFSQGNSPLCRQALERSHLVVGQLDLGSHHSHPPFIMMALIAIMLTHIGSQRQERNWEGLRPVNIGNHMAARLGFRPPQDSADVFHILGENQLLPWDLAQAMMDLARFRNLLVQVYWTIDHQRVFDALPARIETPEAFARQVAQWLKQHPDRVRAPST